MQVPRLEMRAADRMHRRNACTCGCVCCSSVSSAMFFKIRNEETNKKRLLVSVGVQTVNEDKSVRSVKSKNLSADHLRRPVASASASASASLPKNGRDERVLKTSVNSSKRESKQLNAKKEGLENQQTHKRKIDRAGMDEIDGVLPSHHRLRLSLEDKDAQSVQKCNLNDSQDCEWEEIAASPKASTEPPPTRTVENEQSLSVSATPLAKAGFWLDPSCTAGKKLINTLLKWTQMHALALIVQPDSGSSSKQRDVKIGSPRCEKVSDETRLLSECGWLFMCADELGSTYSSFQRFASLTAKYARTEANDTVAHSHELLPRLVVVSSKPTPFAQKRVSLQTEMARVAGYGFALLEVVLIFSWYPNTSATSDKKSHSKSAVSGSKAKRRHKSTKNAKAIVRCTSAAHFAAFKAAFGDLFEVCVYLDEPASVDAMSQYFGKMEANILAGASRLVAVPNGLRRKFDTSGYSHRVIDVCISNVVPCTLIVLVEVYKLGTVDGTSFTDESADAKGRRCELKNARPMEKHPDSKEKVRTWRQRKIVMVDFAGTVSQEFEPRFLPSKSDQRSYVMSRLLFDYRWQSQQRVVLGAFDTQRFTVRLCSVFLTNLRSEDTRSDVEADVNATQDLFFDVYLGNQPLSLDSASAEITPFASDFAGEYEASAEDEFAKFTGAKWGFCAVRNALLELLLHGRDSSIQNSLHVYNIYETDQAEIRSVRFVASRNMLLVSAYSTSRRQNSMHFLSLNSVTKLFEPTVVTYESAACSTLRCLVPGHSQLLVLDETRSRIHLFAVVSDTRKSGVQRSKVRVHGDRFFVGDDLRIVYEGCFPEFSVASSSGSSTLDANLIRDCEPEADSDAKSFACVTLSHTFKNLVWCAGGSFYATACQ